MFCDRERGEAPESDQFLDLVERLDLPAGHALQQAELGRGAEARRDRSAWRDEYHAAVVDLLKPYGLGVLVMAGYMLIPGPTMGRRYPILNLHPALPGGPTGTWQEVIWRLLEEEADETGAMIHIATAQLDRGPVVSYFRLPLRGDDWDPLGRSSARSGAR